MNIQFCQGKVWPQVGLEPMPLTFQASALTTRSPTPPLPWHPQSKGLCRARPKALTLTRQPPLWSIFAHLHIAHLHMEASTSS